MNAQVTPTVMLVTTLVEDFQNSKRIEVDMTNRTLSVFAVIDDTGFSGYIKTIPLKREDIGNKIDDVYATLKQIASGADIFESARKILNILGIDSKDTIGSIMLILRFSDFSVIMDLEHRTTKVFYGYDDGENKGKRLVLLRSINMRCSDVWTNSLLKAINTKSHEDFMDLVRYVLNV